jgi:hypothetical protein
MTNKRGRFLSALAAGTAAGIAIFITPAPQAEPTELDCATDAPCAAPRLVALPPDGPEGEDWIGPPLTQDIVAASGPAAAAATLGWDNNTMTMPLHRRQAALAASL